MSQEKIKAGLEKWEKKEVLEILESLKEEYGGEETINEIISEIKCEIEADQN